MTTKLDTNKAASQLLHEAEIATDLAVAAYDKRPTNATYRAMLAAQDHENILRANLFYSAEKA